MNKFSRYQKLTLTVSSCLTLLSSEAIANNENNQIAEQITIFGQHNPLNKAPGSAHELTQEDLDTFRYTDVMRNLAEIPGIYVQEEDGYGLRPNIGMRGTGQNRSEKITVMEDGVVAAPAPYAAPAAYYFPTPGRMSRIEALKGGSTIKHGPRTTGGVVNLISRQIPNEDLAVNMDLALGQDGFAKMHTFGGGSNDQYGAVTELFRYQASGFRNINHIGGNTGFQKNDVLSKIRFNSSANAFIQQAIELKLQYSDEKSNETYMGLTRDDYYNSPYSRYSASQLDQMNTEHKLIQLNHDIELIDNVHLGTTIYYNNFQRNWYKTSKINNLGLGKGGIELASDFDNGRLNTALNVDIKANNREYLSQGIQTQLNLTLPNHQLEVGVRLHEDYEDRFQWVDQYQLDTNFQWSLTQAGIPGSDANRVDSAKAFALYAQDTINYDKFTLVGGFRYEDVHTRRKDWGTNNQARLGQPIKDIENNFDDIMPSIAGTYQVTEELQLLAGVQRGFSPASPGNAGKQAEKSWNYELGSRYQNSELQAELVAFYSDYTNMHGTCTASQSCNLNNIGDQYNSGEVSIYGLELSVDYQVAATDGIDIPMKLNYTFTSGEFNTSFDSQFDIWGQVIKGDELPYSPENLLQFSIGAKAESWEVTLAGRYTSDIRTKAGSGSIPTDELIEAKTIFDLSARYFISEQQETYLTVENLFDTTYMTTMTHGSIFSGKPLSFILGYTVKF